MTTLTRSQLEALLNADLLEQADSEGVSEGGLVPTEESIKVACAMVDYFVGDLVLAAELREGWARALAAYYISSRLGTPSEAITKTYSDTLQILKDGKAEGFRSRSSEGGSSGSGKHINTSKF